MRIQTSSKTSAKGFTILELLVVVAIIAMLFSAISVILTGVKERSRDAKRMSDMRELQKSLNLYFTERNRFPISTTEILITGSDPLSLELENAFFITEAPADPLYPSSAFQYTYISSPAGSDFTLSFCLETDTIKGFAQGCGNTFKP